MYRIALVNMPMADLAMPSLALTQLQSVVKREMGGAARAEVHYLNHDFAEYLGVPAYLDLGSFEHHPTGLGEWFFRQAAFPELPDNSDDYFGRYYPAPTPRNRTIREFVAEKRAGLVDWLDGCIDRHGLDQADLVGFTSMFMQNVASLALARRIKARNPRAVVAFGGANCEGGMGRTLADQVPEIDFVFSGPSLRGFPRLVRALMAGDRDACDRIDGVFTSRNRVQDAGCATGKTIQLGGPPAVRLFGDSTDIDELVELEYEPFLDAYESRFTALGQPRLFFETSRGCWWGERAHCTFCGLNGSTIRFVAMRPDLALRVLGTLFQHSDRVSHLSSVDNILPKNYITDVLPYLDPPENVSLFYEVKADLDEDDFRALARARVLLIQPGIESLNTSTLKLMRKGTSAFQNVQFLINCVRYGISPLWNLLIAFPREEPEVYEKYLADLPLLTHLPPPGGVFPIRFDRFSPYYEEAAEYGLDLHPLDWYGLTYPFAPGALAELAYYFADHNYAAPYAANAAKVTLRLREKVERWTQMWQDPARRPRLELRRRNGVVTVFDSRGGTAVEYPLAADRVRVLEALATPKKPPALLKELPGVDLEAAVADLRAKHLLFGEGDRLLSLVVPPPTPVQVPVTRVERVAAAV